MGSEALRKVPGAGAVQWMEGGRGFGFLVRARGQGAEPADTAITDTPSAKDTAPGDTTAEVSSPDTAVADSGGGDGGPWTIKVSGWKEETITFTSLICQQESTSGYFRVWFTTSPASAPYPETYPQMVLALKYTNTKTLIQAKTYSQKGSVVLSVLWGNMQADKITNETTKYISNVVAEVSTVVPGKIAPNWNTVSGTIKLLGPLGGVTGGAWVDAPLSPTTIPFTCKCLGANKNQGCD